MADVHLQSLLIWSSLYRDVKGLPLKIEGGQQYRPLEFEQETYATMQVREVSNHNLTADVVVHDRSGTVSARVDRAQITLSERLDVLFADNQLEVPAR
jgi:hypothetical protein